MRKSAILLMWWFFWAYNGTTGIAGPFESQATCEYIRAQFADAAVGAESMPCLPDDPRQ